MRLNSLRSTALLFTLAFLFLFSVPESFAQFSKPNHLSKEMKAKFFKTNSMTKKTRPIGKESLSEIEPNNTLATANALPLDSIMEALINPAGDVDFFQINAIAGQTLAIDIDADIYGSMLDSYLELYDSAGTLLADNDDDGMWLDSKIIYTFSQEGNYFVKVTDLSNDGGDGYYYFIRAYEFQTQGALNLSVVNSWTIPGAAYLIRKNGNILLTIETNQTGNYSILKTWNISDIQNPVLFDSLYNAGMINDIVIAFNRAYLAMVNNEMGIKIVDISNPANLVVDTLLNVGETNGLFILDSTLYAADGGGITVYDLTDPSAPAVKWTYTLNDEDGSFIAANEDYVYFTATDGVLRIVSQNTHHMVGNFDVYADLFTLDGSFIYFSAFDNFIALDVSDPSSPQIAGMMHVGGTSFKFFPLMNAGYLPAGNHGVKYISTVNPTMLSEEGFYFSMSDFFPFTVVAENDMVYAASGYIQGWGSTPDANRIVILKNELLGVNEKPEGNKPSVFDLYNNYPNPFNPSTTIRYRLNSTAQVSLKIYNILGQEIRTLVSGIRHSGMHEVMWDGKNQKGEAVSSGIYFYRLQVNNQAMTRKMTLMK